MADFISKFSYPTEGEVSSLEASNSKDTPVQIKLETVSSNQKGTGAGLLLESLEGKLIRAVVRFGFLASNNEAEYKALLAGIRLAKEMGAESISGLVTLS